MESGDRPAMNTQRREKSGTDTRVTARAANVHAVQRPGTGSIHPVACASAPRPCLHAIPSSPRHSAGFTLMELLVASMLFSIVMTAVYTLCNNVILAWRTTEQDYDAYQNARNVATLMQREFNSAIAGHLFEGTDDEFTLFTVADPLNIEQNQGRALLRVRYRYNKAKDELVREEAQVATALPMALPDDGELPKNRIRVKHKEDFVVASGVKKIKVAYEWVPALDPNAGNAPSDPNNHIIVNRHSKKWRLGMPQAVRVTLTLADPKAKDKDKVLTIESRILLRAQNHLQPLQVLHQYLREAL